MIRNITFFIGSCLLFGSAAWWYHGTADAPQADQPGSGHAPGTAAAEAATRLPPTPTSHLMMPPVTGPNVGLAVEQWRAAVAPLARQETENTRLGGPRT